MKKKWWIVETQATVRRTYEVLAEHEKDAIAMTVAMMADEEEDIFEEAVSATPSKVRGD